MGELCLRSEGTILACFGNTQRLNPVVDRLCWAACTSAAMYLMLAERVTASALFCSTNSSVTSPIFGCKVTGKSQVTICDLWEVLATFFLKGMPLSKFCAVLGEYIVLSGPFFGLKVDLSRAARSTNHLLPLSRVSIPR
jgi:hypothetical protein